MKNKYFIMMNFFKKKHIKQKGWGDITIQQFQELTEVNRSMDKLEVMLSELEILTGVEYEVLENKTYKDIEKMYNEYSFINELPTENKVEIITIGNEHFKLTDFNDLTLAQFIDCEALINDGVVKNLHKILSIIYLPIKPYNKMLGYLKNPITRKYDLEEYVVDAERDEKFLSCSMADVYPTVLFFYRIVKIFLMVIQTYSMEKTQMEMTLMGAKMKMMMEGMDEEQLMTLEQKLKEISEGNGIGMG